VPDSITQDYINSRRRKIDRSGSVYFTPDLDAEYAGHYVIDLAEVESSVAVYPNPDDVVPVSEKAGMPLDGVFIGACTTTEEELVLAALVLKAGLAKKLPLAEGKRQYVPGSLPIVDKLRTLGLLEIYKEAGFTRGPPGCSLCVGLSAEKAMEGETWLTSQNRNFQNRMGKGSFGHLAAAMVCAASSFSMTVTSPAALLAEIDEDFFREYQHAREVRLVQYVEPRPGDRGGHSLEEDTEDTITSGARDQSDESSAPSIISSRIVALGDFIDTDALAPGPTLTTCATDEEFGEHVLEHTHPDFRSKVKDGQRIVVGGNAFGVGSSREVAVSALKGAGVLAVIARSFAFIYSRNQPSLGLLGITMDDEAFYEAAQEDVEISIDVPQRQITVAGKGFPFRLSNMEYQLTINNGIAKAYGRYGKSIWEKLMGAETSQNPNAILADEAASIDSRLNW